MWSLGSLAFGAKGAFTHSPSADRPGLISTNLREGFEVAGFPLDTGTTLSEAQGRLIEAYPHPALLSLTRASRRLPYKVGKSSKYWPGTTPEQRKTKLLEEFEKMLAALEAEIQGISLELPQPPSVASISGLKRYEDSLDALVCAWIGAKYLEGDASPYCDDIAAIWIPREMSADGDAI